MQDLHALSTKHNIPLWQLEIVFEEPMSDEVADGDIEKAATRYRKTEGLDTYKKATALHHWRRLCLKAAETATTVDELRRIYSLAPGDEVTRGKILLRRTELASTVEEIQAILGQSPSNLKVRYLAEEKWREISRRNIEAAQTLCEALEAFRSAPSVRTMQVAAIHSCFQFAEDTASAKRICLSTNATSECREIALQHWLRVAATPQELDEVLKHCFDHVDIRNEALLKIISLYELVPA